MIVSLYFLNSEPFCYTRSLPKSTRHPSLRDPRAYTRCGPILTQSPMDRAARVPYSSTTHVKVVLYSSPDETVCTAGCETNSSRQLPSRTASVPRDMSKKIEICGNSNRQVSDRSDVTPQLHLMHQSTRIKKVTEEWHASLPCASFIFGASTWVCAGNRDYRV